MSRKVNLDSGVMLKKSEFQAAFHQITRVMNSHPNSRLEIELLENSHILLPDTAFLQDGLSVAISKSKLLQAFIIAHKVLFAYLRNCPADKEHILRDAATIMLLMDSEHLTAANVRKRLLQNQFNDDWTKVKAMLDVELCWVDGYLTSHLHRHTKSPTLWSHRRWVLEQFQKVAGRKNNLSDFKEVVLVSAERHPRNYYAWSHLRWLLSHKTSNVGPEHSTENSHLLELVSTVQDWCRRNPSDTSGFSFLIHCLTKIESKRHASTVFENLLRLAIDYKWAHESVWVFLRTLASSELEGAENFSGIKNLMSGYPDVEKQVESAREWCRNY